MSEASGRRNVVANGEYSETVSSARSDFQVALGLVENFSAVDVVEVVVRPVSSSQTIFEHAGLRFAHARWMMKTIDQYLAGSFTAGLRSTFQDAVPLLALLCHGRG